MDRVRYVGDVIAAVAAEERDTAEEALDLIEVEYEPLPAVFDPAEAMKPYAPIVHDERTKAQSFPSKSGFRLEATGNILSTYHVEEGDVGVGFGESDEIFEDRYSSPKIQHAHLEPHTAVAYWEPSGKLVVYTSTQTPSAIRAQLADLFDLPQSKVRVIVPFVGGGYGAKTHLRLEPLIAALARKARRPVQWVLTREEVFLTAHCQAAVVKIKTGVKKDGTIVARQVEGVYDAGAYALTSTNTARNGGEVSGGPYRIKHQDLRTYCVYTNTPPTGPYRGFGVPQVCWAYESQMDDIARRLGIDPLELRLEEHGARGGCICDGGSPDLGRPIELSQACRRGSGVEGDGGTSSSCAIRKSTWERASGNDQDDHDPIELFGPGAAQCGRIGGIAHQQCRDRPRDADFPCADCGRGVGVTRGAGKRDISRHRCDAV